MSLLEKILIHTRVLSKQLGSSSRQKAWLAKISENENHSALHRKISFKERDALRSDAAISLRMYDLRGRMVKRGRGNSIGNHLWRYNGTGFNRE